MLGTSSYCFLVEVSQVKHNHMHAFLGDKERNKIRDIFHGYLNMMIEGNTLSKGKQLRIEQEKYLQNIEKYR